MASNTSYRQHESEKSDLHRIVRENLSPLVAFAGTHDPAGRGLPHDVKRAFEAGVTFYSLLDSKQGRSRNPTARTGPMSNGLVARLPLSSEGMPGSE